MQSVNGEYRNLNNGDIENIQKVAEKVANEIDPQREESSLTKELNKLIRNPILYLKKQGLKASIISLIKKNRFLHQDLLSSLQKIARKIQSRIELILKDCVQCKVGLLILIPTVLALNLQSTPALTEIQNFLTHLISCYKILIPGIPLAAKVLLKELKKLGLPHITPENLAEFLCFQAGICSEKGVL